MFGFADRTVLTISDDLVNALVGSEACAFNCFEMVAATTWPGADGWLCSSLTGVNWSPIWFTVAGQRLVLPLTLHHHHILSLL